MTPTRPNNWRSFFSESAWKYFPNAARGAASVQPETDGLKLGNPAPRRDVYDMLNWWLQKGVDGFRLDVINLMQTPGLPEAATVRHLVGMENYVYGPRLHEYLKEMNKEPWPEDSYTVGECRLVPVPTASPWPAPKN
ncbi:MAG: alpha-amylase family glycosyl hydrolase [Acutalibacteraceae bacterium]